MNNPIPWKNTTENKIRQEDLVESGNGRTVLIFGITGQDGYYLTELLTRKGFNVVGVVRRTSTNSLGRVSFFLTHKNLTIDNADITDFSSVLAIIKKYRPDWIFNLAAQSHVGTSFDEPFHTLDVTGVGCLNILESLRFLSWDYVRFYQASSSEMFGDARNIEITNSSNPDELLKEVGQSIDTQFSPQSPYAIAKVMAHQFCQLYRKAYDMNVRCGILFNHESEMRGHEFVTRKITRWLGNYRHWSDGQFYTIGRIRVPKDKIYLGKPYDESKPDLFPKLQLGNLNAVRDWGHAEDYVRAMVLMMQHSQAEDWVVATGEEHSIKDFLAKSFEVAELGDWQEYVQINESLKRPAEVPYLKGDSSPIREKLGWKPIVSFDSLVFRMVEHDINLARKNHA